MQLTIQELLKSLTGKFKVSYNNETLITSDIAEWFLLRNYKDFVAYGDTPAEFLQDWINHASLKARDLYLELQAYYTEYNPINNYDSNITETFAYGKQINRENLGNVVEKYISGEQETLFNQGLNTETSTNAITSYDTTAFSDTGKTTNVTNEKTDKQTNGQRTDTVNKNNVDNVRVADNYENVRTFEQKGNIGVTTSQQMIESEIKLRANNIVYNYIRDFANYYCFYLGGV